MVLYFSLLYFTVFYGVNQALKPVKNLRAISSVLKRVALCRLYMTKKNLIDKMRKGSYI